MNQDKILSIATRAHKQTLLDIQMTNIGTLEKVAKIIESISPSEICDLISSTPFIMQRLEQGTQNLFHLNDVHNFELDLARVNTSGDNVSFDISLTGPQFALIITRSYFGPVNILSFDVAFNEHRCRARVVFKNKTPNEHSLMASFDQALHLNLICNQFKCSKTNFKVAHPFRHIEDTLLGVPAVQGLKNSSDASLIILGKYRANVATSVSESHLKEGICASRLVRDGKLVLGPDVYVNGYKKITTHTFNDTMSVSCISERANKDIHREIVESVGYGLKRCNNFLANIASNCQRFGIEYNIEDIIKYAALCYIDLFGEEKAKVLFEKDLRMQSLDDTNINWLDLRDIEIITPLILSKNLLLKADPSCEQPVQLAIGNYL